MSATIYATKIGAYHDIPKMQQFEGVNVHELERRMQPGEWVKDGLLGERETFHGALLKDWPVVQHLGTTHIELAAHLRNIWEKLVKKDESKLHPIRYSVTELAAHTLVEQGNRFKDLNLLVSRICEIAAIVLAAIALTLAVMVHPAYVPVGLAAAFMEIASYSWKNTPYEAGQELQGRVYTLAGVEPDLFAPTIQEGLAPHRAWQKQMEIVNPYTKDRIVIGEAMIGYIEKYGFYGGGKNHIDPRTIVRLLVGNDSKGGD